MNYKIVIKVLGILLLLEAIMMLPSFIISLYYGREDVYGFIITILLCCSIGFIFSKIKCSNEQIKTREGFTITALGWIIISLFGSFPFVLSGYIPSLTDAFFETVSGFTTTGATLLSDIEILPKGLLFWRSFTHWIGGMGILVFTIAIIPRFGIGGIQIFRAESPGPVVNKISPKIKDTAKILYKTYIVITCIEIVLLILAGMSLYDSIVHTFGTVGTGGFSVKNKSIGAYPQSSIHIIIAVFMALSGENFSLFYALYKKKWKTVFKDQELRLYIFIILLSTIFITINIIPIYKNNIFLALRDSFFQVSSIITTTGYSNTDFNLWPTFSKGILLMLMFIGGCAGSTAGGIKVIRILAVFKFLKREIIKIFHPKAVIPIRIGEKSIPDNVTDNITSFFIIYILTFTAGTLLILLNGVDFETAISSVACTLGNVGPGFNLVGPYANFGFFSDLSKNVFSVLMLMGRLELFTFLALFSKNNWKHK